MNATTSYLVIKELAGNPAPHLHAIQTFLAPHLAILTDGWITAWTVTAIVVMLRVWYAYKEERSGK